MKNKNYPKIRLAMCRFAMLFIVLSLLQIPLYGQKNPNEAIPKYEIPNLKYPVTDAFVITFNALDYGADPTGEKDNAAIFRTLLKKLEGSTASQGGVNNGGVLFLPEGTYKVESSLVIPKGVTIRGEWKKPEKGLPIAGTIITTNHGRGEEDEDKSLLMMEPSSGVKDLAFWYPGQEYGDIVPYPPTILYGKAGYFGNEYCIVQNVTLVNSYNGIIFSKKTGGGGAPNAFGIYGTPLKTGIEIDEIAEVGRIEGVDFSYRYWADSGLAGSPSNNTSFRTWLKDNATAIVMRRNDWTFTSRVNAEGYFIGFHAIASVKDKGARPNGQNYDMTFTDCTTAIYAQDPQSVGIMFHKINVVNCEYGLFIPNYASGVVQLSSSNINATKYAIASDSQSSTRMLLNQCKITAGAIETLGGTLVIMDSDIDNSAPQIILGPDARGIITGNRFANEAEIQNNSMYECQIDHSPIANMKKIPEFPFKDLQTIKQKPSREVLYVATSDEFGAKNDGITDNTSAIQNALDRAKSEGGGVVYLPSGKYKVLGNLTIPQGVELKGSMDVGSVPTGPGSILEAYAGKGDENAEPFIKLSGNSGIRGVVINYPEQMYNEILDGNVINPYAYPYSIQVTGKDAYIVNVGFRSVYRAIDLFSHRCDNAYIEYPAGHVFNTGIRVGNGTEGAIIRNAQFNTIGYACGAESKFGRWKNSPPEGTDNQPAYRQNYRDLEFFILGDCKNLTLFNNFHFGCNKGTIFANEGEGPSGIALGHGIDAAIKALYFEKVGEAGFDLIGSQIVSLQQEIAEGGKSAARYVETTPGFEGEATLFAADFWGGPHYGVQIDGGTINMQAVHFDNPGDTRLAQISENGMLNIFGSSVKPRADKPINDNAEPYFTAQYSIVNSGTMDTVNYDNFVLNLTDSPIFVFVNKIPRNGWTATASNANYKANNALDDDTSTRWDSEGVLVGGEWFIVDMKSPQTFNKIILDQGSSAGDYPIGYEIYLSDDGEYWGEAPAITGKGTGSVTNINFDKSQVAQYIKIVQTGETGRYWSIHEFFIADIETGNIGYPTLITTPVLSEVKIYPADGLLNITGLPDTANINIYSMTGQLVKSLKTKAADISFDLKPGIYIVRIECAGNLYHQKILVR